MTEKQSRFVDEYIATANASEAARRAGYSSKTACSIGERLLRNVEVRAAIDERLKELESQRVAETKEVLEHLSAVLRGEIKESVVTQSGKTIVVPVAEKDRLKAADMLLKVRGEYRERVDVQVDASELFITTLEKVWAEDNGRASP